MKKIVLFSMVALTALFIACANPSGGGSKNPVDPGSGDVTPTIPDDDEDPTIPPENAKTFKLTLKAGDSSSETVEFDVYEKTSTRIPLSGFTKEGYYIAGWSENENAAEPQYKVTEKLVFTGNKTLYAVWADATGLIKITYNFDDDSGKYLEQYCEPGVPVCLEIGFEKRSDNSLSITNYWLNSENKSYILGCEYTFTESINLYASWINPASANKLYFHKNDGTDTTVIKYLGSGNSVSGFDKNVDYEREGYTFVGWGQSPDTNQPFNVDFFLNTNGKYEEKHYYAIWQSATEIKVTYYRSSNGVNGEYDTTGKKEFSYSLEEAKNIIIADNFFTEDVPEGKVFAGWTNMLLNEMLEDSEKTVPYYAGKKVNTTRDLNLFPVYVSQTVIDSKAKKAIFKANYEGCSDYFEVNIFVDSLHEYVPYPKCPYTREGYVFNGWSTYASGTSGSGADSSYESTYTVYESDKEDKVFYATWLQAVKITYNANDGSENPETYDVVVGYNKSITTLENPFESPDSNLYFAGWGTAPDSTTLTYPTMNNKYTSDVVLYAIWQPNVTVTFDSNFTAEGQIENEKIEVVAPKYSRVAVPEFKREHYEFQGLGKANNSYAMSDSKYWITAEEITYYAVWKMYQEIRFYNNDGTDEYTSVYAEKTIYFRDYIPVREGYSFVGWGQTKTDTKPVDKLYQDRTTDSYGRPYNYYAIWTQEKVQLSFYYSEDTESAENSILIKTIEVLKYSEVIFAELDIPVREREGFTLQEWYSRRADGSRYQIFEKSISRIEDNLNVYTYWRENKHIIYYPNFETDQKPVKQYFPESGVVDLRLNTFVREGYVFVGWSNYESGTSIHRIDGEKNVYSDSSLYAIWKQNPTITFNANDGTDEPETFTQTFVYNEETDVPDCPFTREGYTFLGWSEGTGSWEKLAYVAGKKACFKETITVYAVWVKDSEFITITFDANFIEEGQTESKKVTINVKPNKTYYTPLEAKAFTRDGYKLDSYFYGDPVSTRDFNNGSQSSYADKTWYAHWKKYVTVTYNLNDGSENPILLVKDSVEGEKVYITSKTPEKEGYTFKGWSKSPSDTRARYTYSSSSSITMTNEDLVLYAVWKKK